ncbi:hypothetical protein ACSL103130_03940 [Actinomyces slackii]
MLTPGSAVAAPSGTTASGLADGAGAVCWPACEAWAWAIIGALASMTRRTGRKYMTAEVRTRSRVSWLGLPGSETTMFCPPCLEIWASATPEASTRWRMTSMAWSTSASVIVEPSEVVGVRMIWVPPSRSRARPGVIEARPVTDPATRAPKPRAMRMRSIRRRCPERFRCGVVDTWSLPGGVGACAAVMPGLRAGSRPRAGPTPWRAPARESRPRRPQRRRPHRWHRSRMSPPRPAPRRRAAPQRH